ncbi:hypothetical protein QQO_2746 [Clostridioides difficile P3]|nr:hypothetical protein QQO_2746 [Clostridioides difficile P3]
MKVSLNPVLCVNLDKLKNVRKTPLCGTIVSIFEAIVATR